MARPDITSIGIAVNKRSQKWNYFILRGTNFDARNATLQVVDSGGTPWRAEIRRPPHSTATQLVCRVKTPTGYANSKRPYDTETLDITVTNPGPESDTQHEDIEVLDDPNP